MNNRKEERKSVFSLIGLYLHENIGKGLILKLDESRGGFRGLYLGSQFPGRTSEIEKLGAKYHLRWINKRFGFFYHFGAQKVAA